ncbi:MAG TPA: DUF3592 domain-containing protein [Streptosporangiaceae bacterium]
MEALIIITLSMPLSIFLFLGSKLVRRLRLEQHGLVAQARVTSVREWSDEGFEHQIVDYQFAVSGEYYSSSTTVPLRGEGYAAGDHFPVLYLPSQPHKAQPVSGGPATSTGLTAFAMLAMVAVMVWEVWLLTRPHL